MYQREVIRDEHTVNRNERNFKKKDTNIEIQEKNMNDLVESASRVIAPLWPISTFALITLGWGLKSNHLNKSQIG